MPYVTNFMPGEHSNIEQVVAETNKRFGTDLEIRTHPRPDNTNPGTVGMHSLWSPHDWVMVQEKDFPYSYLPWWEWHIAHLHWSNESRVGDANKIWAKQRATYRAEGCGMDHPSD